MDKLTFISKMIDSISWPLVTLILGLAFRKQIAELFPYLKKLKAGPVEAEFEMEAKQVLANTENVKSTVSGTDISQLKESKTTSDVLSRLKSARNDPTGMILESWSRVDGALFRLGQKKGICVDPLENTNKVYRSVMSSGVISGETKRLIMDLYELRNRVAHVLVKPTINAAQDYALAADKVIGLIDSQAENLA
ncbi:hypothetical protein OL309_002370 [Vibrio parahaemolyticus]|nr:hypothetical protein [Vibrio parahaemolyticus]